MTSLRVEDVGNNWLPTKVSLELAAGECVVISGPSGVGKSLLLRAIADLDIHQGDVHLGDNLCADISATDWRKQVGLLAADSAWWGEQVAEHMPKIPIEDLEALGFGKEVMKWSVDRLSTGEKQRLAILRLLANKPSMLLLDEPTANLDPDSVKKVETLLLDYCRNKPAGLIWVSHDTAQAERIADRRYHFDKNGLSEVKA
ncbi:MAG: ATP-binding cassette domain-containing protein [Sulfuriflexus sp.]|nr:ATP-binding cassette domain-containing protein [Sulfuriflexus sp.]